MKLYWRIKRPDGTWTYKAASVVDMSYHEGHGKYVKHVLELEE